MSGFTISEDEVRRAAMDGLRSAVSDALRTSYRHGDRFSKLVEQATRDAEPAMQAVMRETLVTAVRSPDFARAVQAELVKMAANKFGGALTGVLMASAKAIGNDPAVREAMVKAAREAVTNPGAPAA